MSSSRKPPIVQPSVPIARPPPAAASPEPQQSTMVDGNPARGRNRRDFGPTVSRSPSRSRSRSRSAGPADLSPRVSSKVEHLAHVAHESMHAKALARSKAASARVIAVTQAHAPQPAPIGQPNIRTGGGYRPALLTHAVLVQPRAGVRNSFVEALVPQTGDTYNF